MGQLPVLDLNDAVARHARDDAIARMHEPRVPEAGNVEPFVDRTDHVRHRRPARFQAEMARDRPHRLELGRQGVARARRVVLKGGGSVIDGALHDPRLPRWTPSAAASLEVERQRQPRRIGPVIPDRDLWAHGLGPDAVVHPGSALLDRLGPHAVDVEHAQGVVRGVGLPNLHNLRDVDL